MSVFGSGGSTPTPPVQSSASDVGRATYQKDITAYNQWYDDRYRKKKKRSPNVLGPVSTPLGAAAETEARRLGD